MCNSNIYVYAYASSGGLFWGFKMSWSSRRSGESWGKRQSQRKAKGGGTQGRGKHTINPLPKNGFGPPHLWYDFPLCSRNVILLRGNGHRPDKSHLLRPPKLVLEGVHYGTFPPPPPKSHDTFCPPLCEFPTKNLKKRAENRTTICHDFVAGSLFTLKLGIFSRSWPCWAHNSHRYHGMLSAALSFLIVLAWSQLSAVTNKWLSGSAQKQP